jgi:hypothetical protein
MKKGERVHQVFVDSLLEGTATLLCEEEAIQTPAKLLPADTREGSWLELRLRSIEPPASARTQKTRRERLAQGDDGRDLKL